MTEVSRMHQDDSTQGWNKLRKDRDLLQPLYRADPVVIRWFWAVVIQQALHKPAVLWLTYLYVFQVQYKRSFMLRLESIFDVMHVQRWNSLQLCSDSSL